MPRLLQPIASWAAATFDRHPPHVGQHSHQTSHLISTHIAQTDSKAVDNHAAIARLAGRAGASCDTVVGSGLCLAGSLYSSLCPLSCDDPAFDSCVDRNTVVASVWQSLGRTAASTSLLNCSYTRRALGCTDATFAALCPTTCNVCLNGTRSPGPSTSLTTLDFDYARDVVRQEIRETLYACAMARRAQAYACGSENIVCPAL
eukprot:m.32334 g.32334  ORF g.32334 m.32334 type:complete len:203 (+) comp9386_c0_seq1:1189-1797(+)